MRDKSMGILTILFISLLVGCKSNTQISDIIPPVKLLSGIPDSIQISDLYYSDDYNISMKPNSNLEIDYNIEDKKLFIKSDSDFEGMTLLEFKVDMNVYQIPVISKKEKYYDFSFKSDKEYTNINLFGSFKPGC